MTAHGFHDTESEPTLYMRTTNEMLEEFSYLGEEEARWVVIQVPNQIAQQIGDLLPVPKERFPPEIPGSEERLRNRCYRTAKDRYGDPLPPEIQARLDRELNSIIGNGYAVMYVAAELVVQKSLDDGYLVGSRGSVGSSFAATMGGITEVNPLPAHYICPNSDCKHFEWGNLPDCDCGVDLPDKMCPECGTPYEKDGFNIPFEVFLGFKGDKEPDIDLNFAGEYQPTIHKYVEEIFGAENVFRAGTIGTIQGKTAEGYVRKFFEETGMPHSKWDIQRLAIGCNEVKKTTGQHPGGIVIVPKGHEIYEFCPVQHPANTKSDIITTHFDYHKIDQNLLKLDLLGHDAPSIIRMLEDMTGIGPDKIPLRDDRVNSLFLGTKALEIKIPDYKQTHGTFGIPEFGTKFTRQMLDDTKPTTFADLVRIAGFSHGTDVWLNNAQDLIRSGIATMKDAISTRDDIMNYLIAKGVPEQDSFKIMEAVRKGKGVTEDQAELMSENNVPDWYIESCRRIKYMFPKAHAVAYVMMSYRIAYFKVYHPQEFYAVYFTMHIDDFNCNVILGGIKDIVQQMQLIDSKGKEAQNKELSEYTVFEVAYEMYARGYSFVKASLGISDSKKFKVIDGKIVIPFQALEGVGETAAMRLTEAFEERPFISLEDVRVRAGINKSNIETLKEHGVLDGLPEANQITMF